ncbi:MAG: ABC transporter permease [Thermomicrobiales bacterium]|nr:ABC transporter permease [Thermomicrobiales bacterium]
MTSLTGYITDSRTFSTRSILIMTRQLDFLLMSISLPVLIMLSFVYVFGSAMEVGSRYGDYVVPGVILLCAGFGAANAAVTVANDVKLGTIDRYKSMPIHASTVLVGHVVASLTANVVATTMVILVAFATGFRANASLKEWVAAIVLVVLFILSIAWISTAFGLLVKNPEAAGGATFVVLFIPYLSSALVPVDGLPRPVRFIAEHQPFTPLTETLRSLLLDTPMGNNGWIALAWLGAMITVGFSWSTRQFARKGTR